jgi:hypothetical protein
LEWAYDKSCCNNYLANQPKIGVTWNFSSDDKQALIDKLNTQSFTLSDIAKKIFVGLQTSADKIYILKLIEWGENRIRCFSTSLNKEVEIETGLLKPFLMGKDVKRYENPETKNVVIFPYLIENGKAILMPSSYIKTNFPNGWQYLHDNKVTLENREKGRFKSTWWQYGRTNNLSEFEVQKIIFPDITNKPEFTYDISGKIYHTTTIYGILFNEKALHPPFFYLGILNSKITWLFVSSTGTILRGGYTRFHKQYIERLPIPEASDFQANELIELVSSILKLYEEIKTIRVPNKIEQIKNRIQYTDDRINQLVYELYGMTKEEIKVIEDKI